MDALADTCAAVWGAAAPAPAARSGPYKHLMTGVSFMLPFVVAGGLLIALAGYVAFSIADRPGIASGMLVSC